MSRELINTNPELFVPFTLSGNARSRTATGATISKIGTRLFFEGLDGGAIGVAREGQKMLYAPFTLIPYDADQPTHNFHQRTLVKR